MARLWPFGRQNQPQLPPPITQYSQDMERRWPLIATGIIAVLVIVGLAVLAGLWIYDAVHHGNNKSANVASNNQGQAPQAPSASSNNGGQAGTSTPTPSSTSGQTSKALPNNGPGDVIAVFVGATLAAAGLHYILTIRRGARGNS